MYDNNTIKSLIKSGSDEEIAAIYDAQSSPNIDVKKILVASLLSVTAVAFAICFYIVVFCNDVKKGVFAYDSVSYWTYIAVIILALAFSVLTCLIVTFLYYGIKAKDLKNACSGVIIVLTDARIAIVNTNTNEVVYEVLLANVSDISRYTNDQLKILTYSGEDLIIKPDDTQNFIDTYPGLLRSVRQKSRRLANEKN